jgi:uncharacterized protein YqjF (DUF2071 family)
MSPQMHLRLPVDTSSEGKIEKATNFALRHLTTTPNRLLSIMQKKLVFNLNLPLYIMQNAKHGLYFFQNS